MSATTDRGRVTRRWALAREVLDTLMYCGLLLMMLVSAYRGEVEWVAFGGFMLLLRAIEGKR